MRDKKGESVLLFFGRLTSIHIQFIDLRCTFTCTDEDKIDESQHDTGNQKAIGVGRLGNFVNKRKCESDSAQLKCYFTTHLARRVGFTVEDELNDPEDVAKD